MTAAELAATRRAPGRPFDEGASAEILDAALELLSSAGFSGVTVDAVAQRAGVSKATIYRRWPTKEALLLATARCVSDGVQDLPDTGSLPGDLLALLEGFIEVLTRGIPGQILPDLIAEGTRQPEIRQLLSDYTAERRDRWRAVFERAGARGELRDGVDVEVAIDCLTGALFTRLLITGAPLHRDLAPALLDLILPGIAA